MKELFQKHGNVVSVKLAREAGCALSSSLTFVDSLAATHRPESTNNMASFTIRFQRKPKLPSMPCTTGSLLFG